MAEGSVVSNIANVAATGFLTIQPAANVEWVIHNLYYAGAVEVYKTDGVNSIKFDGDTSAGAKLGFVFHVTNTQYIQIKNPHATAAIIIGYDGVQTSK